MGAVEQRLFDSGMPVAASMEKVRLGQSRPLPESLADLFRRRQQQQPGALISLDVPSGLCYDHGNVLG